MSMKAALHTRRSIHEPSTSKQRWVALRTSVCAGREVDEESRDSCAMRCQNPTLLNHSAALDCSEYMRFLPRSYASPKPPQHLSLRISNHHLTLIHARVSHWQQTHKFACILLCCLLLSSVSSGHPALIYIFAPRAPRTKPARPTP